MRTTALIFVIFLSVSLGLKAQQEDQGKKDDPAMKLDSVVIKQDSMKIDSVIITQDSMKNDTMANKGDMMGHPFMRKHENMKRFRDAMEPEMMMKMFMKHQEMMGMMMQKEQNKKMYKEMPMKKFELIVKILPDLKEELSLTTDQIMKLLDLRASFERQNVDFRVNIEKNMVKLKTMLKDEASAEDIRDVLEKISDLEINKNITAYKTADRMKELLNSDQIKKLEEAVSNKIEGSVPMK